MAAIESQRNAHGHNQLPNGVRRFEIVWPQARAAAGYITFESPEEDPNRAGRLAATPCA